MWRTSTAINLAILNNFLFSSNYPPQEEAGKAKLEEVK